MRGWLGGIVVIFVTATTSSQTNRCVFPGPARPCAAPRGEASVEWTEATNKTPHQLWLHRKGAAAFKLLESSRHVEVLWAPDGRTLAITDHSASTDSAVWIVKTAEPARLINVEDGFIRALGRPRAIYEHGHRYFSAVEWASSAALVFQVQAHDGTGGSSYQRRFQFDLDGSAVRSVAASFGTCQREAAKLAGTQPVRVGGRIRAPKQIRQVFPNYPELPPGTTVSGIWTGEVLIGNDGKVVQVWPIREPRLTPPFPPFNEASVAAVRQWEFQPLMVEKVATPFCMTVTMNINWQ